MRILAEYGRDDLARVYVAEFRETGAHNFGRMMVNTSKRHIVEFVESLQPPFPRKKKQVVIVSSLFGCPGKCLMCDAGGEYFGKLSVDEILQQVDHIVQRRFPGGRIQTEKFKIQFARMGEPSLNHAVLDAMEQLPRLYGEDSLNVSLSTIAPSTPTARIFFKRLIGVKNRYYPGGRFQLQFSIHTTDDNKRNTLIPMKKLSFAEIAEYGTSFSHPENGDKKVTLNFAPVRGCPIDAKVLRKYFDPAKFLIKLTPLNPTVTALERGLVSAINPIDASSSVALVESLKQEGYQVILSIGELEENKIGSNCGQYVQRALDAIKRPSESYDMERYNATCINK